MRDTITKPEDARLRRAIGEIELVKKNLREESFDALSAAIGLIESVIENVEVSPEGKVADAMKRMSIRRNEREERGFKERLKKELDEKTKKDPEEKPEEKPREKTEGREEGSAAVFGRADAEEPEEKELEEDPEEEAPETLS